MARASPIPEEAPVIHTSYISKIIPNLPLEVNWEFFQDIERPEVIVNFIKGKDKTTKEYNYNYENHKLY